MIALKQQLHKCKGWRKRTRALRLSRWNSDHRDVVGLTVVSPRRPWIAARAAFLVASGVNELPALFAALVVGSTALTIVDGNALTPVSVAGYVLTTLSLAGLAYIAVRGAASRDVVASSLDTAFGEHWLGRLSEPARRRWETRPALLRGLIIPFVTWTHGVRRIRGIAYGKGRNHVLDVLVSTRRPATGPVMVYFHGGGYFGGTRTFGAQSLLTRLASRGWVVISADYRVRPRYGFADHLVDAKRAIAWAHEHAGEYGGAADQVFTAGSSAGAHLVTICALSEGRPSLQPGFEDADTSSRGVIGLSGYYGYYYGMSTTEKPISSPLGYEADEATPPMFLAHGALDSYTPVGTARALVSHLRSGSSTPVVYAELPGAQHNFDLFRSPRFEAVCDGIDVFTDRVLAHSGVRSPASDR